MAQLKNFYAHGKLLLSGEYLVLDGTPAMAVPLNKGQHLRVKSLGPGFSKLIWRSLEANGEVWFNGEFSLRNFNYEQGSNTATGQRLSKILKEVKKLSPGFLRGVNSLLVETAVEFDRSWGLGSSSTLIDLIAQWAEVDPFILLKKCWGGSGYDIACARAKGPIMYQCNDRSSSFLHITLPPPPALEYLYLVHLGRKQDSSEAIKEYQALVKEPAPCQEIAAISFQLAVAQNLNEWENLLVTHERLLASYLGKKRIQSIYFDDWPGVVKSLGAWGGDLVLATSTRSYEATIDYFQEKGFQTILPFKSLVIW